MLNTALGTLVYTLQLGGTFCWTDLSEDARDFLIDRYLPYLDFYRVGVWDYVRFKNGQKAENRG